METKVVPVTNDSLAEAKNIIFDGGVVAIHKFVDVDEQNREEEPPQYSAPTPYDDDEEYVAPDDDYTPPEPPMRKGELKPADEEMPF